MKRGSKQEHEKIKYHLGSRNFKKKNFLKRRPRRNGKSSHNLKKNSMALDQGNSFCLLNAFHLEEVMSLNIQTSCLVAPFSIFPILRSKKLVWCLDQSLPLSSLYTRTKEPRGQRLLSKLGHVTNYLWSLQSSNRLSRAPSLFMWRSG